MIEAIQLQVGPRFVKEEEGFRPFQKETLAALKDPDLRMIFVEAPVGSGKSYIIRNLVQDSFFENTPIILTYPTKILMEAQIGSMRGELEDIAIWPDEPFIKKGVNVFNYSTSSLISYLKKYNAIELNKSELLKKVFSKLGLFSKKRIIVTSPDVLHLLVNIKAYTGSRRLQNYLQGAFVFFDEFHLYSNLVNFPKLVDNLLKTIASKVILLSATPYGSPELSKLEEIYTPLTIDFSHSEGDKTDYPPFNYSLNVEIHQFRYTNRQLTLARLQEMIPIIEKPAAIIFDSIFRLEHLKRRILELFGDKYQIYIWSGMEKSKSFHLDETSIVLGTSSIEVGIDMNFRSLITEASYWTSAIQRIGRVGRKSPGNVYIFTNRDLRPYINGNNITRDEFEKGIIKEALRDPIGKLVAGEMFRGDSYSFILQDVSTDQVIVYSEPLFAMYEIEDKEDEWRTSLFSFDDKRELLKDWGVKKDKIDEILLYDKVFPLWGAVRGRLRGEYQNIEVEYEEDSKELQITSDKTYIFYGA